MSVDDDINNMWEYLVESGAIILDGISSDGEPIYTFDMDVLKEVNPELYHAHLDEVDEAVLGLVEKGLVTLDFSGDEVLPVLTDKGEVWAETIIDSINET